MGEVPPVSDEPPPVKPVISEEPPSASQVPVLLYHHLVPAIEEQDESNTAVISVEDFAEQMAWLAENEYYTPTLEEFCGWLAGETWLPEKSVLITFDDGYDSVGKHAFPVLQQYGLRATVFVIGTSIGRVGATRSSLGWNDLKALYDTGLMEVQSHTFDGHGKTPEEIGFASWDTERIRADLDRLGQLFVEHGMGRPWAFAYPFGVVSPALLQALSESGFRLAFTTEPGLATPDSDPLLVPRIAIWPGTDPQKLAQMLSKPSR